MKLVMNSISVVVPAYNEESRIKPTIESICSHMRQAGKEYEIVVVVDGCTDGTLETVQQMGTQVVVVSYERNRGKGYAVRQGVAAATKDTLLITDADLAAPIDQLVKLEAALEEGCDVAIGSRAVSDANLPVRQPYHRALGGRLLNLLIQALATPGIKDTQCGFKLFRTPAAKHIFEMSVIDGFGFDIEILYLARRLGCRVKEVGITWSHQEGSKVRPMRDGLRILRDIARIRMTPYLVNSHNGEC